MPRSLVLYSLETDFLPIACKLVEKMYAMKENTLFLCDNEDEVTLYNAKLWTFSKLSFIPSGNKRSLPMEDAVFCHTWFSTELVFYNSPQCLLHNGLDISNLQGLEKFNKIVDIFNKTLIQSAKKRFVQYKELGFSNYKLWIQNKNTWEQGEL